MTTELTIEIANEIQRLHEFAESKASEAKANMGEALQAAVECGGMIEEAKGMTKGQILGWLRDNVPCITPKLAKAYMSLFHVAKERGIENVDHRQLLLLGVIEPREAIATALPAPSIQTAKWAGWAGNIRAWWSKETADRPVSEWTQDERDAVRNQLEPIVDIWKALESP